MEKLAHVTIGFISVSILYLIMIFFFHWPMPGIQEIIILIVLAYTFSLLPDIDIKSGTIVWHFIGVSIIGLVVGYFAPTGINGQWLMISSFVLLVLTFLCAQFAGHRGPIHTVWAGAIFTVPIYFIFSDWRLCVLAWVAFYSHLAADGYWFKV